MASSAGWWIGGGVVALGLAGVVVYAVAGTSTVAPAERGYEILTGCSGVKILDETKALAFAAASGAKASKMAPGDPAAWIAEAANALGSVSLCTIDAFPPSALGFIFRILRAYITGANTAGKLPVGLAEQLISGMRTICLTKGVPEKELT